MNTTDRYVRPDRFTEKVMNPTVRWLARHGISLMGARELLVVGRSSGVVRSNVVNVLELDGRRYLVAPRGVTQWVRNLRAAGCGRLRLGRRTEGFDAVELGDDEKLPVLREYLRRWGWEVGQFFEGVDKDATDAELAVIAPGFPVFALSAA
ncbi:MAG: nitroreductase family deazaflavin-dependent oxidoreductase [Acidimicrobiales bacterium]|nr:nitroreductase family deazaflavin-dependent oxidoreductase [Acidimicrobiales bacterium]MCB9371804.1 nitroreductase family deazaflavin-dependent oxidoreductase [Microthrixaceae bacterium]